MENNTYIENAGARRCKSNATEITKELKSHEVGQHTYGSNDKDGQDRMVRRIRDQRHMQMRTLSPQPKASTQSIHLK